MALLNKVSTIALKDGTGGQGQNLHDWCTPQKHQLPLSPTKRHNAEDALQEWSVQKCKVQSHAESDSVDEDHVLPEGKGEERFRR